MRSRKSAPWGGTPCHLGRHCRRLDWLGFTDLGYCSNRPEYHRHQMRPHREAEHPAADGTDPLRRRRTSLQSSAERFQFAMRSIRLRSQLCASQRVRNSNTNLSFVLISKRAPILRPSRRVRRQYEPSEPEDGVPSKFWQIYKRHCLHRIQSVCGWPRKQLPAVSAPQ
jgi:hypothetical protein